MSGDFSFNILSVSFLSHILFFSYSRESISQPRDKKKKKIHKILYYEGRKTSFYVDSL